jgi:hypothetical protein
MDNLPLRIRKLAHKIFAGQTGFSGPEIHEFFAQYSDEIPDYTGRQSRWTIFDGFLCTFPIEKQKEILLWLCNNEISMSHGQPSEEDKQKLRAWLLETPVALSSASTLQKVTSASVYQDWQKALERVQSDPEGAITSARTLVETVCKYILEEQGLSYKSDGDLPKLYKQTASTLNLSPDQHGEEIFKQILGGCTSVVNGLAGLRNEFGDAHGKGKKYVKPKPRHAKLAVSLAGTLATFLIETYEERPKAG